MNERKEGKPQGAENRYYTQYCDPVTGTPVDDHQKGNGETFSNGVGTAHFFTSRIEFL